MWRAEDPSSPEPLEKISSTQTRHDEVIWICMTTLSRSSSRSAGEGLPSPTSAAPPTSEPLRVKPPAAKWSFLLMLPAT